MCNILTNKHQYDEKADVINPAYDVYFCSNQCGCYVKKYKTGNIEYGSISKSICPHPHSTCPNI